MDEQNRRTFLFFDRLMKKRPDSTSGRSIPKKCEDCMYYQPKFRFRICLFSRCHYGFKDRQIFREHPLKKELILKSKRKEGNE